jgi:hypothetical protein
MSVLNDYECGMHGLFEAFERKCPHGCSRRFVKLVFLKPVGTMSGKSKWTDNELKSISRDYNLSDIKAKRDSGTSCMTELGRNGQGTTWLDVPHAKPGTLQAGGEALKVGLSAFTPDKTAGPGMDAKDFKNIQRRPTQWVRPNDGFTGKL